MKKIIIALAVVGMLLFGIVMFLPAMEGNDGTSMSITFMNEAGEVVYFTSTQKQPFDFISGALTTASGQLVTTADIQLNYVVDGVLQGSTISVTAVGKVSVSTDMITYNEMQFEDVISIDRTGSWIITVDLDTLVMTGLPVDIISSELTVKFDYTLEVIEYMADGAQRSATVDLSMSLSFGLTVDPTIDTSDLVITGELSFPTN